MRYATSIIYETDGARPKLPKRLAIPDDVKPDQIADYISDLTGWLVETFEVVDK